MPERSDSDASAGELPLRDPRWVLLEAVYDSLTERLGDSRLAILEFNERAGVFGTCTLVVWTTDGRRELSPPNLWADYRLVEDYDDHEGLEIRPRRYGVPYIPFDEGVVFVWKPDIDKLWPDDEPPPAPNPEPGTNAAAIDPPASPARAVPTPTKRLGTLESQYEAALTKHVAGKKRGKHLEGKSTKAEWIREMVELHGWKASTMRTWLARPEINALWLSLGGKPTSLKMRGNHLP